MGAGSGGGGGGGGGGGRAGFLPSGPLVEVPDNTVTEDQKSFCFFKTLDRV